jgi:hypothetical protein
MITAIFYDMEDGKEINLKFFKKEEHIIVRLL